MMWEQRDVRLAWVDGQWVKYPIQVPMLRSVEWTEEGTPFDDIRGGIVVVWIGPGAHLPAKIKLDPPRPLYSLVPLDDLSYEGWQSWHAKKVISPERGCAWPFEIERGPVWAVVTWKVWDYEV